MTESSAGERLPVAGDIVRTARTVGDAPAGAVGTVIGCYMNGPMRCLVRFESGSTMVPASDLELQASSSASDATSPAR